MRETAQEHKAEHVVECQAGCRGDQGETRKHAREFHCFGPASLSTIHCQYPIAIPLTLSLTLCRSLAHPVALDSRLAPSPPRAGFASRDVNKATHDGPLPGPSCMSCRREDGRLWPRFR